jgi:hypothetical protein
MKIASLTSALLVVKGPATPTATGFGANIQFLHKSPRQRIGGDEGITRVSLRMNTARHMRLKLAAAQLGSSNHALLLEAIDHYIDNVLPMVMADRNPAIAPARAPGETCAVLDFARAQQDQIQ